MLSYATAAISLLLVLFGAYPLVISLGLGAAAYGVANEKRWGYWLGIVLAGLSALLYLLILFETRSFGIILNLAFAAILLALYLHPQSREYQRVWFK